MSIDFTVYSSELFVMTSSAFSQGVRAWVVIFRYFYMFVGNLVEKSQPAVEPPMLESLPAELLNNGCCRCLLACASPGFVQMHFNFFLACGALFSVCLLHFSLPFVKLFHSLSVLQLIRSSFFPLFLSSYFSVPISFLALARQFFTYVVFSDTNDSQGT